MKTWIVPSNDNIYLIADSLNANGGKIDWRQTNKFAVGDIVYIYKTKPEQRIRYKMEVVAIDIDEGNTLDEERFWKNKDIYYSGLGSTLHVRFNLIEELDDENLSFANLRQHGITSNIQSTMELKGEVLRFVESVLAGNAEDEAATDETSNETYSTDYPEDDEQLYEGALVKVKANRYERNRDARQKCLDAKGYKCVVCGMDFEEKYGLIGRHFIEVHHVVPISSIGQDYKVDEIRDLVPVCSNCHSMLHQKPGRYEVYTVDELKEKVAVAELSSPVSHPPIFIGILTNVYDVPEIKEFIDTYMQINHGATISYVTPECMKKFGEFYPNMKPIHWYKLTTEYIKNKTQRFTVPEDELVTWNVAEP